MASIKKGTVSIGGMDFHWSVLRQPKWTRGRFQDCPTLLGLAILVEHTELGHRDLVLEFDIDPGKHGDMPQHQRFRITDSRLAEAVAAAMKAGWDPESRGRRFVHEAGELQRR